MGWSKKYKKSINCNNPKGFSQKAHCAGRKKQENKMSLKLEELVGKPITEQQFDEAAGKKDACYHKVKARYDVWPSAYASGALVKCRKVGAKNWCNKSKKEGINEGPDVDLGKKLQKIQKQIYALGHSYSKKANVPAMMNSFLIGLKMNLKKGKLLEGYPGKSIKPLHDDEVDEKKLVGRPLVKKAIRIAKKMGGNMTGAVKKIEKLKKGLSKQIEVEDALRKANESINEKLNQSQAKVLLQQLGGNKFIMMTGAKNFGLGPKGMGFKIGRNSKKINYIRIDLDRGKDLYNMEFIRMARKKGELSPTMKVVKKIKGVYADQLQKMFTKYTGMYTSL